MLGIAGSAQAAPERVNDVHELAGRFHAEKPDHRHRRLLRTRRKRPRCRAAEQRYELAPFHSITSSVRKSKDSEIVNPNALAVLRLITSSNLTGRWIGKSAGPVPLIIWSAKPAKRR